MPKPEEYEGLDGVKDIEPEAARVMFCKALSMEDGGSKATLVQRALEMAATRAVNTPSQLEAKKKHPFFK